MMNEVEFYEVELFLEGALYNNQYIYLLKMMFIFHFYTDPDISDQKGDSTVSNFFMEGLQYI